jgi:hypothetical protein
MSYSRIRFGSGLITALVAVALMLGTARPAQAQEGPNNGNVSLSLGFDVVTAYFFRGMAQENKGLIVQPYAEASFNLVNTDVISMDAYVGTWNSVHSEQTSSGAPGADTNQWYESDFYFGLSYGLPFGLGFDISYTVYYGPSGSFAPTEEVGFGLTFDDSEYLGDFALSPYALLAVELSGGADGGNDKGAYLELGVEPSFVVYESESYPITFSIPVKVGLSLSNYYEDPATGKGRVFGFISVAGMFSTPLSLIPSDFGAWSASVGVEVLTLGKSARAISGPNGNNVTAGSEFEVVGIFSLGMTY